MKLCLGVGPLPVHKQHLEVMNNFNEWILVDMYVDNPKIKKWDATKLSQVKNNSVEIIYASHLLEHFPHIKITDIIKTWHSKLINNGRLILNVPDLEWACKELIKLEKGYMLNGYYNKMEGEHGLLSIFYGSQSSDGEYHKTGFTQSSIIDLMKRCEFSIVKIDKMNEAHDMGCLLIEAIK